MQEQILLRCQEVNYKFSTHIVLWMNKKIQTICKMGLSLRSKNELHNALYTANQYIFGGTKYDKIKFKIYNNNYLTTGINEYTISDIFADIESYYATDKEFNMELNKKLYSITKEHFSYYDAKIIFRVISELLDEIGTCIYIDGNRTVKQYNSIAIPYVQNLCISHKMPSRQEFEWIFAYAFTSTSDQWDGYSKLDFSTDKFGNITVKIENKFTIPENNTKEITITKIWEDENNFLISILMDALLDDEIIKITKEIFCDIDIATLIQCIKFIKEILLCLEP